MVRGIFPANLSLQAKVGQKCDRMTRTWHLGMSRMVLEPSQQLVRQHDRNSIMQLLWGDKEIGVWTISYGIWSMDLDGEHRCRWRTYLSENVLDATIGMRKRSLDFHEISNCDISGISSFLGTPRWVDWYDIGQDPSTYSVPTCGVTAYGV